MFTLTLPWPLNPTQGGSNPTLAIWISVTWIRRSFSPKNTLGDLICLLVKMVNVASFDLLGPPLVKIVVENFFANLHHLSTSSLAPMWYALIT